MTTYIILACTSRKPINILFAITPRYTRGIGLRAAAPEPIRTPHRPPLLPVRRGLLRGDEGGPDATAVIRRRCRKIFSGRPLRARFDRYDNN